MDLFLSTVSVNYLAVLVAALVAYVIGFLWHGPVFGSVWMNLAKITPQQMEEARKKSMAKPMILAFIQQLILVCVSAHFLVMLGVTDIAGALTFTVWAWLGFIVTTSFNGYLWENKSLPLFLFNIAYHFVALAAANIVLVLWK
jgi:hypothetical protein